MKKLPTKSSVIAILLSLAFLPQFITFAVKPLINNPGRSFQIVFS